MSEYARPVWPVDLLSAIVAGLGHGYLGYWKRGAIWLGLYVLALAFLSARSLSGAFDPGNPFFVTALQFESVSYENVAVPLSVLLVCLLDVYLLGLSRSGIGSMDENGSRS